MKNFGISVGFSFVLGIAASIIMIIFIEGWGSLITIVATLLSFGAAGFYMGKTRPQSSIYSGMAIAALPFLLIGGTDFQMFDLLTSPSKIDEYNFYALLPLIVLVAAYAGVYLGYRMSKTSPTSS